MYYYKKGFYKTMPNEGAKVLTEERYAELMELIGDGGQIEEDNFGNPYVLTNETVENNRLNNLRIRRQRECFDIVDRPLWLASLTEQQYQEILAWREAWLKVTETKVVPQKPSWLN